MKVKVTVGMCVKNCEATVQEAIDSVVNQDYPHELMEIIVVYGNSKDKTVFIMIDSISKTNIQTKTYHDKGKGLGVARQMVVNNALGEYIVWVDGDIILPKNYLQKQVEFMDQNPQVGVAQGKWGTSKGRTIVAVLENMSVLDYEFKDAKTSPKSLGCVGGIYRVRALRQVGGFDGRIKGAAEDRDVTARIRAAGWLLSFNKNVELYHKNRETWRGLWGQYFWWGYGEHYISHIHKLTSYYVWPHCLYKIPPVAFMAGLRRSIRAYKASHQKISFLLPFHNFLKMIAWCFGFVKSHKEGYGHEHRAKSSNRSE